jgi:hypothetical protein
MTIGSSGKTIKSGPEDRVFVYFADHGAPGAPSLGAARGKAAPMLPVIQFGRVRSACSSVN